MQTCKLADIGPLSQEFQQSVMTDYLSNKTVVEHMGYHGLITN